jgi:hypothetical protein
LLGDRKAIEEGLAKVTGTPGDDTLANLLRKLWLDAPPIVPESAVPSAPAAPAKPAEKPDASRPEPKAVESAEPERPATTP